MNVALEAEVVAVRLVAGPLEAERPRLTAGEGASVVFEGIVRPREAARSIDALQYEVYEPMTQQQLERLARETVGRHGLLALEMEHSVGRVPVGAVSFRLRVAAAHRASALAATGEFIDRMKAEVPLWKVPEWSVEAP